MSYGGQSEEYSAAYCNEDAYARVEGEALLLCVIGVCLTAQVADAIRFSWRVLRDSWNTRRDSASFASAVYDRPEGEVLGVITVAKSQRDQRVAGTQRGRIRRGPAIQGAKYRATARGAVRDGSIAEDSKYPPVRRLVYKCCMRMYRMRVHAGIGCGLLKVGNRGRSRERVVEGIGARREQRPLVKTLLQAPWCRRRQS